MLSIPQVHQRARIKLGRWAKAIKYASGSYTPQSSGAFGSRVLVQPIIKTGVGKIQIQLWILNPTKVVSDLGTSQTLHQIRAPHFLTFASESILMTLRPGFLPLLFCTVPSIGLPTSSIQKL